MFAALSRLRSFSLSLIPLNEEHMSPPPTPHGIKLSLLAFITSSSSSVSQSIPSPCFLICSFLCPFHSTETQRERGKNKVTSSIFNCYFYTLLCTVTLFDLFHTAGIINTVYLSHYCSFTIHIFSFYIAMPLSVQVGGFVMPVIYTNWNKTWTHERWRQRENRRQRSHYQDD